MREDLTPDPYGEDPVEHRKRVGAYRSLVVDFFVHVYLVGTMVLVGLRLNSNELYLQRSSQRNDYVFVKP